VIQIYPTNAELAKVFYTFADIGGNAFGYGDHRHLIEAFFLLKKEALVFLQCLL
jgi:hypothetical protein